MPTREGTATTHGDGASEISPSERDRFPFTKFIPPEIDASRVDLDRAVERLEQASAAHRVVLLRAPGGSGKTTLAACWAHATERPCAWLRIDRGDAESPVAAAALLAAVRRTAPTFGHRLERLLQAPSPDSAALVTAAVNDFGDIPPLALVLDDLHVVPASSGRDYFTDLVARLPRSVRVIATSRSEPALSVARMRLHGDLIEFGLDDLRLDRAAVGRLLRRAGHASDTLVDRVLAQSGGWAAAVRLATLRHASGRASDAAGTAEDRDEGVRAFDAQLDEDVARFLADEVLEAQPEPLRTFLLESAILDEMRVDVCEAVTLRSDAGALLVEAQRRDLFVAHFRSSAGEAWRYHDLFATFLRSHLARHTPPDEIVALHRRAATALSAREALAHHFAAGDHDAVAVTAADAAFSTLNAAAVPRLAGWVERLPGDVIERHPRARMVLAWHDELRGRSTEVRAAMEPLWRRLRAEGRLSDAADAALLLVGALLTQGDLDTCDEVLRLTLLEPLDPWRHTALLSGTFWRDVHRQDWSAATRSLHAALEVALGAANPAAAGVLAGALGSAALFLDHAPSAVLERVRRLDDKLGSAYSVGHTSLRPILAAGALLALDLVGAEIALRRFLEESNAFGRLAWVHQDGEILLLQVALARGDDTTVRALCAEAFRLMPESPLHEAQRPAYAYAALRSAATRRDQGDLAALTERLLPVGTRLASPQAVVAASVIPMLIAEASGMDRGVADALERAEAVQAESRCWLGVGFPGLARAQALLAQGRAAAALDAAGPTLEAAQRFGAGILAAEAAWSRPLLLRCARAGLHSELVHALLAAVDTVAGAGRARRIPGTTESLTAREVEVLRLVAEGLSNRAVAEALAITEATVKTHLTRVLSKLDARSRTHATSRARQLGLI